MKQIFAIAQFTYLEAMRERMLYGVLLFGALLTGASFFLATISLDQNSRILQNTGLAAIHFLSIFITVFVATNSLARDTDMRAVYFLFSKPISKLQYILGKYCGFVLFMLTTVGILSGLFVLGLLLIDGSVIGVALTNIGFTILELLLLLGLASLFASFTAPLNASLYTLALYFIGHSQTSLKNFVAELGNGFLNTVINGVYYILPNLEKYDVGSSLLYNIPLSNSATFWTGIYTIIYLGATLYLASIALKHKEV